MRSFLLFLSAVLISCSITAQKEWNMDSYELIFETSSRYQKLSCDDCLLKLFSTEFGPNGSSLIEVRRDNWNEGTPLWTDIDNGDFFADWSEQFIKENKDEEIEIVACNNVLINNLQARYFSYRLPPDLRRRHFFRKDVEIVYQGNLFKISFISFSFNKTDLNSDVKSNWDRIMKSLRIKGRKKLLEYEEGKTAFSYLPLQEETKQQIVEKQDAEKEDMQRLASVRTEMKKLEVLKEARSKYDEVWEFHDGRARVRKDVMKFFLYHFGYIDMNGEEVIPLEYDKATDFKDGIAQVLQKREIFYINTKGERIDKVIEPVGDVHFRDLTETYEFVDGIAKVKVTNQLVEKYGFIDKSGKIVIPIKYDRVGDVNNGLIGVGLNRKYGFINTKGEIVIPMKYESVYFESIDHLIPMKMGGKWGFMDRTGNTVIPPTYEDAYPFSDGYALVKLNGKDGIIDTSGNFTLIEEDYFLISRFHNGLARVRKDDKYGFINPQGKLVIPCVYDKVGDLSENLIHVKKGDKYGFINSSGEVIIPIKYDYAKEFRQGLAPVERYRKTGFINKQGKTVISFIFDLADSFENDRSEVMLYGKFGIINRVGDIEARIQYNSIRKFQEGLAAVQYKKRWGYIDTDGKMLLPAIYDEAQSFSDGLAKVKYKGRRMYINKEGVCVLGCD